MRYYIFAIGFLLLCAGCKPLRIIAHTEGGSDTYCVYKISDIKNNHTTAAVALKKGEMICIYCQSAFACGLNDKKWVQLWLGSNKNNQLFVSENTGFSYYIEAADIHAMCVNCPGSNKFELYSR